MNLKNSGLVLVLIGALFGLSLSQLAPALAQKEKKEIQRWEYRAAPSRGQTIAQDLETAGNDGWELVAVSGDVNYRHFFFKRPK